MGFQDIARSGLATAPTGNYRVQGESKRPLPSGIDFP